MDPESNGNIQEEIKECNPDDFIVSNNEGILANFSLILRSRTGH